MFYTVYKTTNEINGKIYVGCHITKDPFDDYLGSGNILWKAIAKYGKENFTKDIIAICDSEEEMFQTEKMLVSEVFLKFFSTYNLKVGGQGGFDFINNNLTIDIHKKRTIGRTKDIKRRVVTGIFLTKKRKDNLLNMKDRRLEMFKLGKLKPTWAGKKHSEETKRLMSIKMKEIRSNARLNSR